MGCTETVTRRETSLLLKSLFVFKAWCPVPSLPLQRLAAAADLRERRRRVLLYSFVSEI